MANISKKEAVRLVLEDHPEVTPEKGLFYLKNRFGLDVSEKYFNACRAKIRAATRHERLCSEMAYCLKEPGFAPLRDVLKMAEEFGIGDCRAVLEDVEDFDEVDDMVEYLTFPRGGTQEEKTS